MKKIMAMLLLLSLSLYGCGNSGKQNESYITIPNDQQIVTDVPATETTAEEEINGEYYENDSNHKKVTENPDTGEYRIAEYFENGNPSKIILGNRTTGEYSEVEFYENGNIRKSVGENPDTGEYWDEEYFDNGSFSKVISGNRTTGEYLEVEFYENGNNSKSISKSISHNPITGKYGEWEYYEDGTPKAGSYGNHTTGEHHQEEFYENGKVKYNKQQYPNQIFEGRYDEEGYCTYMYSQMPTPGTKKGLYRTEECFSDENGKLIKIILNGEVYDDPLWLAQQAPLHKFRE